MSTGFHWNELYAWHDTGTGSGFLSTGGLVEPEQRREPGDQAPIPGRKATDEKLLCVHTREYSRGCWGSRGASRTQEAVIEDAASRLRTAAG